MRRLLSIYYLATPLFAGLDLLLGVNVRTAAFGDSPLRWLYYAGSLACGLVAWRRPAVAPYIGMVESGANILLLILSIYLPIWDALDTIETSDAALPVLTGPGLANVIISGAVLAAGFYLQQASLIAARRGGSRP